MHGSVAKRTDALRPRPYIQGMTPTIHKFSKKSANAPSVHSDDGLVQLPHERDEHVGNVADAPDPVMVQAKKDLDAGLVDTDMHATPGADHERRMLLVPGPGGVPLGVGPQKR